MLAVSGHRISILSALVGAAFVLLSGCGSGDSELTTEQLMAKLAGHPLTSAEVAERIELADLLCGFDAQVLVEVWDRLDPQQLEFQDYVFGQHCQEQLSIYREARPNIGTAPVGTTSTTERDPSDPPAIDTDIFDFIVPADDTTTTIRNGGTGTTRRSTTQRTTTTQNSSTATTRRSATTATIQRTTATLG